MSLRDFLDGASVPSGAGFSPRCSVCTNEKLAQEVAEWVQMRQNGEVSHSLNWIWSNYFRTVHRVGAYQTLRHHIRFHLGIDDV